MTNDNGAARRKVVVAGAIGSFVEWYDFGLYASFSTTIAHLFFPKSSPAAALLSTFAVFALGFGVRPLGAIVFGRLGDRIGRRPSLVLSVTAMSATTVALGLLPGYASIGTVAPALLLLCRLVQGFSVGGEYTGATIYIIEHAPEGRRGRYASVGPASSFLGQVFGALIAVAMTSITTSEQLASWGWRVPFLAAAPLALIGLYLRLRAEDSPVFTALRDEGNIESAPVRQALRVAKKQIFIFIGWAMANAVASYLMFTFFVSYLTVNVKFSNTESLIVQVVVLTVSMVGCVVAGYMLNVIGHKRMAVVSVLCLGAWAVPAFLLLQHSSLLGACLIMGLYAAVYSVLPVITSLAVVELFPARVRSSASALSYNICFVLFGGTAPYLGTWLVGRGYPLAPGYYLAGLCVVAAVVAAVGIGNRRRDGHERDEMQVADERSVQHG